MMIDAIWPTLNATSSSAVIEGAEAMSVRSASAATNVAATPFAAQSPDFASVLAKVALNAVEALKSGEANAIAGVQGKAPVQQVVEAVMSAEQTLQGAIAIRDKVVAAYLELSRMQI
jgi:flagellar hook-basal body complex protein FliE